MSIHVETGGKPSTWFPPGGLVEQSNVAKNNPAGWLAWLPDWLPGSMAD